MTRPAAASILSPALEAGLGKLWPPPRQPVWYVSESSLRAAVTTMAIAGERRLDGVEALGLDETVTRHAVVRPHDPGE